MVRFVLGFYVLDPLVLVVLTELVWVMDPARTHGPCRRSESRGLYLGGGSGMNGLRWCFAPSRISSPRAYPV